MRAMLRIVFFAMAIAVCVPAAASEPPSYEAQQIEYSHFLSKLQKAVSDGDREAILSSVRLPLRVNSGNRTTAYLDEDEIDANFEQIFDEATRRAILDQSVDDIFSRDIGAMVGHGEVWFDFTCLNEDCTDVGPVRIYAINKL